MDIQVPSKYKATQKLASLFPSHHIYYAANKGFVSPNQSTAAANRAEEAVEQTYPKKSSAYKTSISPGTVKHNPSTGPNILHLSHTEKLNLTSTIIYTNTYIHACLYDYKIISISITS